MVWTTRAPAPPLAPGAVHVWRVDLSEPSAAGADPDRVLSPDERARAAGFRFDRDRDRFVTAHVGLRRVLAGYLGCPARAVAFEREPGGKPVLAGGARSLSFNLSRSRDLALVAVADGRAVGVDVEWHRPDLDIVELADWLSPGERRALAALAPAQRRAGLFRCWTRKESYVKAHGRGLAMPLDRFTVSVDEAARVTLTDDGDGDRDPGAQRWSIRAVPVEAGGWPDYSAALAVEGSVAVLSLWELAAT